MNKDDTVGESGRLPLRHAYPFLSEKGASDKVSEIKTSERPPGIGSDLKRAKILNLLDENKWLDEFIERYWSIGNTGKGQNQIKRLRRLYDKYLNKEEVEEDDIEESRKIVGK